VVGNESKIICKASTREYRYGRTKERVSRTTQSKEGALLAEEQAVFVASWPPRACIGVFWKHLNLKSREEVIYSGVAPLVPTVGSGWYF
jgi:hypothetical protein